MSCPKTEYLLQEFFADNLAPLARDEMEKHLADCAACNAELEALLLTRSSMQQWQEQRVPHWDRGLTLFRREHGAPPVRSRFFASWQWLPTAASLAMLALFLLNVSFVSSEQGFAVAFGGNPAAQPNSQSGLQAELTRFQAQQRAEMQELVARVEDRLDSNNVRLLQAVMEQAQQTTAENFEQMYSYFEQQRLLDLQDMRVGYEELVNSDYETIRSLQQLANFVSYEGSVR